MEIISQESCQVAIITCFHLIAWSLHVKHGVLPFYSSILVNVRRCELVLRQSCFYSCWILPAAAAAAAAFGFRLLLLGSACCCSACTGFIWFQSGHALTECLISLISYIRLNPDFAKGWNNLGCCLARDLSTCMCCRVLKSAGEQIAQFLLPTWPCGA